MIQFNQMLTVETANALHFSQKITRLSKVADFIKVC